MVYDPTGLRFKDPNTGRPTDLDGLPDDNPIVETSIQARQGLLGWNVLAVLIVSMTLAVIAGIWTGILSF